MSPANPAPPALPPVPPANPRVMARAVAERAFEVSDGFHRSARGFRNRLVLAVVIIVTVAVGLVVLQWRLPDAKIFSIPSDAESLSRWALMILVMVFGFLGALVTTIPSMAAIPTVASPFNFPLQQAFVKISLGSLTALVGVVAIGTGGVTAGFTSLQAMIAIAIVFGAAQQAVTQFLDKRAGEIIDSSP
jgi:hypothetical protein